MIIELRGVEFVNKGAELMLQAIVQKVRKELPNTIFVMEKTARSPTGKLLVADSDNNRILVWNTVPNATGTGASYAINLGDDAWPWGIWSDGVKVAVTITVKGQ